MGVPVADEKTEGPQTIIIFLGFELDSILMEVRIPKDKIMKLQSLIEEILHKSSITLEVMQSLLGSLNFMCRAIVPGRPFCRRLINATRGITKPYHHIRISKAMRLDLQTWLTFFSNRLMVSLSFMTGFGCQMLTYVCLRTVQQVRVKALELIFRENGHMVCGLLNGFTAVLLMTLQYLNCSPFLLLLKSGVSISATKRFYSNVTIRQLFISWIRKRQRQNMSWSWSESLH